MATKFSIALIAATVSASLAIVPAAEAGSRGVALGVGLGVLAVGAMAAQAQQAKKAQARARAQAQAQARAKAQAQARAKAQAQARAKAQAQAAAKRQQQLAAANKAKAAAAATAAANANEDEVTDEVAETTETTKSTPSTYVAAPSSSAALTQVDIDQANASNNEAKAEDQKTVAAAAELPTDTADVETEAVPDTAPGTCKRFVPAIGVAVNVAC